MSVLLDICKIKKKDVLSSKLSPTQYVPTSLFHTHVQKGLILVDHSMMKSCYNNVDSENTS